MHIKTNSLTLYLLISKYLLFITSRGLYSSLLSFSFIKRLQHRLSQLNWAYPNDLQYSQFQLLILKLKATKIKFL